MIVKNKAPLRLISSFVFICFIVALAIVAMLNSKHSLELDTKNYFIITDNRENGSSEASLKKDSCFALDFRLRSGVPSPYAGVSFALQTPEQSLSGKFFDFSRYDSLKISLRTDRMPKVALRMSVSDPRLTRPELAYTARPVEKIVESSLNFQEIKVALADFKVPERWFSSMGLDSPDPYTFLDRGLRLEILTAHGAMLGIPDALEFYGVELFGTNRYLLKMLAVLGILFVAGFAYSMLYISKRVLTESDVEHAKKAAELLQTKGISHTEIALRSDFKNLQECKRVFRIYFKKEFGRGK